jgi:hypothetical protein
MSQPPAPPPSGINWLTLVQRALSGQPLSVAERTVWRLAWGCVAAGLASAGYALVDQLRRGVFDWSAVATAFAVALLLALLKLYTAASEASGGKG